MALYYFTKHTVLFIKKVQIIPKSNKELWTQPNLSGEKNHNYNAK